nr:MAG TPA: hypothetical protein [Caudoviricetes sp.]
MTNPRECVILFIGVLTHKGQPKAGLLFPFSGFFILQKVDFWRLYP